MVVMVVENGGVESYGVDVLIMTIIIKFLQNSTAGEYI